MEYYYIKEGRRYRRVGYNTPDMHDGLYFRESKSNSTRTTSVAYWLGTDPKEPVDVNRLVSTMRLDEELSKYIMAIQTNSDEFEKLKEDSGGFVKHPVKILNISASELAVNILRFIYNKQVSNEKDSR